MNEYDGRQFVGIDLHRQRSVIVRQSESGEQLSAVRIVNDPVALGCSSRTPAPTPRWCWKQRTDGTGRSTYCKAGGARVHLAHPLGVKGFRYRRVKNDVRDAGDLADLLRMNRLPEAWIAPPATRELRELVRYRAKLVAIRSGLKAQVHAVLAKVGVLIAVSDLFGATGRQRLAKVPLADGYAERVRSLLELIDKRRQTLAPHLLTGDLGVPVGGALFSGPVHRAHQRIDVDKRPDIGSGQQIGPFTECGQVPTQHRMQLSAWPR